MEQGRLLSRFSDASSGARRWALLGAGAVLMVAVAAGAIMVWAPGQDEGWSVDLWVQPDNLVASDDMVCGAMDPTVACWDATSGRERFKLAIAGSPRVLAISEGMLLVGQLDTDKLVALSLDGDRKWEGDLDQVMGGGFYGFRYGAQPALSQGVLVLGEEDEEGETLVGIDITNGEEVWRTSVAQAGRDRSAEAGVGAPRSDVLGVVTDGDTFYVNHAMRGSNRANDVVALDPLSGDERWRWNTAWAETDEVLFNTVSAVTAYEEGSAAFILGRTGGTQHIVALDTETGELHWQADIGQYAATVAHDDDAIVVFYADQLRGYSFGGDELWSVAAPMDLPLDELNPEVVIYGVLVAAPGHLYFHSDDVWSVDSGSGDTQRVASDSSATVVAGYTLVTSTGTDPPQLVGEPLDD